MRLREARKRKKFTQQELAVISGVSEWTISRIERWFGTLKEKRRIADSETMEKLAKALEVEINQVDEFTGMQDLDTERFNQKLESKVSETS